MWPPYLGQEWILGVSLLVVNQSQCIYIYMMSLYDILCHMSIYIYICMYVILCICKCMSMYVYVST